MSDPVIERLDALDVEYEIVRCEPALADTAAFCEAYGYALEDSANTIVVAGKADPPVYAACVVLATTRLDVNNVVRKRLGVRRVSFAGPDVQSPFSGSASHVAGTVGSTRWPFTPELVVDGVAFGVVVMDHRGTSADRVEPDVVSCPFRVARSHDITMVCEC